MTDPTPAEVEHDRALTDAMKLMDHIGLDWKASGQMQKFYATNYLVEAVRGMLSKTGIALSPLHTREEISAEAIEAATRIIADAERVKLFIERRHVSLLAKGLKCPAITVQTCPVCRPELILPHHDDALVVARALSKPTGAGERK